MAKPASANARPSEKRKRGRPSVITDKVEASLLDRVTEGAMLIDACAKLGISYRTVAKKEREDPVFMQALARARIAGATYRLERAEKKLDRATTKNIAVVREQVLHLRWVASKLIPAYKDRLELQANVNVSTGPAERPFEAWDRNAKLLWMRERIFSIAQIGKEIRDLWGLEHLAEGYGYLGNQTWKELLAVIDGRRPTKGAALALPAPGELAPRKPAEREIKEEEAPASQFIPGAEEMGR